MVHKDNPLRDNLQSNKDNPTELLVNLTFSKECLMFLRGKPIHLRDNLLCNRTSLTFSKAHLLCNKANHPLVSWSNLVFRGNLAHLNHQANLYLRDNLVDFISQANLHPRDSLFNRNIWVNLHPRGNPCSLKAHLLFLKVNLRGYKVCPKALLTFHNKIHMLFR